MADEIRNKLQTLTDNTMKAMQHITAGSLNHDELNFPNVDCQLC